MEKANKFRPVYYRNVTDLSDEYLCVNVDIVDRTLCDAESSVSDWSTLI